MRHWDETWGAVAEVMAARSLCSRAQVGAVIADATNRIVASSYNGPPAGFVHGDQSCVHWCPRAQGVVIDQSYANCPSLHAEANALLSADKSSWQGGTIYTTNDVCADCAKLIANSGLARVVVRSDGDRAYRNSDASYEFLRSLGIIVDVVPRD
jgi:dCMP deaminase